MSMVNAQVANRPSICLLQQYAIRLGKGIVRRLHVRGHRGRVKRMNDVTRLARLAALAAVAACALSGTVLPTEALAAKKAKSAAQGAQDPASEKANASASARAAYDAGLKAFANGKYQPAVDQFSTAIKAGGLQSTEMAKALYTRGIAYRKLNKPGLAISDLTSALWLKNGLSDSERRQATAERSEAYQLAGLQETALPGRTASSSSSSPSAIPDPTPISGPAPGGNSAGLSAAAIAEAAGSQNKKTTSAVKQTWSPLGDSAPAPQSPVATGFGLAPAAEAAPSSAASPSASIIPSGVSGFFSNLFGGSSSPPSIESQPATPQLVQSEPSGIPQPMMTASTSGPPPVASEPTVSSWSDATTVSTRPTSGTGAMTEAPQKRTKVASLEPPAAKPQKQGKYKLHITAVRSRDEADAIAQKLVAQYGGDLQGHVPMVDEAVIGSMGTFYRVRIPGFASQDQPRSLCNKLRTSGFDCLVVTN